MRGVSSAATVPVFRTEVIARGSVPKVLGWGESSKRSRILSVIRRASLGDENGTVRLDSSAYAVDCRDFVCCVVLWDVRACPCK